MVQNPRLSRSSSPSSCVTHRPFFILPPVYATAMCKKTSIAAFEENLSAREQCELGLCLLHGMTEPVDERRAVGLLRKAASRGYPKAHYWLGQCMLAGTGVRRNRYAAVTHLIASAESDYVPAQVTLADCLLHGKGRTRSKRGAFDWYMRAAERGHVRAMYHIGCMYARGRGVDKSEVAARRWLGEAALAGHVASSAVLAHLDAGERQIAAWHSNTLPAVSSGKYNKTCGRVSKISGCRR